MQEAQVNHKANRKLQGFALVLVLWVLSLLTLMAGSFAVGMHRERSLTEFLKNNAAAIAGAESGIAIAEMMIIKAEENNTSGRTEDNWRLDGRPYAITYDNVRLNIRLFTETGKVNINGANSALLKALLQKAPLPEDVNREEYITRLVGAIIDWRDEDDIVSVPAGAEKEAYKNNGPSNQFFKTLDELQKVLGMTPAIYAWLEPMITWFPSQTEQAQVDRNASKKVLIALLPNQLNQEIDNYVRERDNSGKPLPYPPALASPYINNAETDATLGSNTAVTIISEATLNDGASARVGATVIKLETEVTTPFQILRWQRNYVE